LFTKSDFLYGLLNEIHTQQTDKRKCYCLQYRKQKCEMRVRDGMFIHKINI